MLLPSKKVIRQFSDVVREVSGCISIHTTNVMCPMRTWPTVRILTSNWWGREPSRWSGQGHTDPFHQPFQKSRGPDVLLIIVFITWSNLTQPPYHKLELRRAEDRILALTRLLKQPHPWCCGRLLVDLKGLPLLQVWLVERCQSSQVRFRLKRELSHILPSQPIVLKQPQCCHYPGGNDCEALSTCLHCYCTVHPLLPRPERERQREEGEMFRQTAMN